jgi:hypothetical protein
MEKLLSMAKKIETLDIGNFSDLQSLIDAVKEKGIKDFSKVRIRMQSESPCGCECSGSGYYYGPSIYSDIRVEWDI